MKVQEILNLSMKENAAGAGTIRDYLYALLEELWAKEEGFSGKRPFGESSWKFDFYKTLIEANCVSGTLDEDGFVEKIDKKAANNLLLDCIHDVFYGEEKSHEIEAF